jgi:hypothetical protein
MRIPTRVVLSSFPLFLLCSGWGLPGRHVLAGEADSAAVPDKEVQSAEPQGPAAGAPFPPDGAEGVGCSNPTLGWTPGTEAVAHNLYFGTDSNRLELLGTTRRPEAAISPLAHQTRYYWRIDEVQSSGATVEGRLWVFTTGGLVAWWKLDEADGNSVADASGHHHTGTLAGDAKWQPAAGKLGGALEFDGNGDFVDLGNDPAFDCTDEMTVAAWIKVNKFDRRWQTIIAKGDTSWRLARAVGTNNLEFAIGYPEEMRLVQGALDVNDGEWHHVAGVHDSQRLYLYVDGRLDGTAYGPGPIHANELPVYIGENSQNRGRYWNGLIDDVRLYDTALEQKQIKALAAGETLPASNGKVSLLSSALQERAGSATLIGWWRLDETEGSEAADSSGNGIQGILLGNPQWQPDGGKVGGALKLDGQEDCIEITNEPAFDITDEITVAAWIKVDRLDKDWQAVVAKGDSAWRLHRHGDKGTLAFHGNGIGTEPSGSGVAGNTAVHDGEWHHAVATYDGFVASLYIDGALDQSVKITGRIQTNDYPVLIGENAQRPGREWNGMIDEVCIFRRALDANGAGALYAGDDPIAVAGRITTLPRNTAVETELHGQGQTGNTEQLQTRNWSLIAVLGIIAAITVVAGVATLVGRQ